LRIIARFWWQKQWILGLLKEKRKKRLLNYEIFLFSFFLSLHRRPFNCKLLWVFRQRVMKASTKWR
jgi:hypothetical protein